ncbi:3-isopropylmalate dehydratase small subunit [Sphingomonas sp.]|uniref:3-isopropylmalate dehydratase small subunit n=1 Tax=Sphingomonas sp. TaxID=28214 RepID=UPI00286A0BDA|nr:3-isopropylmalate dehydratase small subunit [Sphingomonas sp.]
MTPFIRLEGIAAALPVANLDTDRIIPAAYLSGVSRDGLGAGLLAPMRYDAEGKEKPDFVLNQVPWRDARILVARENFGCGSSREHAPWALLDFGIRAVIAPSFAEIFHNNCIKNGILPLTLPSATVDELMAQAARPNEARFAIDLEAQQLRDGCGRIRDFAIDAGLRGALLEGLDEIGRTLRLAPAIDAYEAVHPDVPPIPLFSEWGAT